MAIVEQAEQARPSQRSRSRAPHILRAKITLVGLDLVVATVGLTIAGMVTPAGPDRRIASFVMLIGWAVFLTRARLYTARFITRRSDEIRRVLDAAALTAASVAVVGFAARLEIGRWWLALGVAFGWLLLSIERELVRSHYDRLRRSGRLRRKVLMIGSNEESRQFEQMFESEPELGYDVVQTIDPATVQQRNELTTRVLATAREFGASGAIVAASAIETKASNRLIRDLMDAGIHVELSSTLTDIDPGRLTVRPLGRFPVVYVEPVQRSGWRALAKRVFDLTLATLGLVFAAPVFIGLALAVKLGSSGPVIFRQDRVGQNGVSFDVLKFRTMVTNAEEILQDLDADNEGAGPLFKMKDDPRVTKIGKLLRKTSLDELPQLINVVKGEMSLVGPRPALASEMAAWDDDLYGRLRVKPGITGMWQVSGRSETTFEEYTRLDLYYVDNWSLFIDLTILARTIPAVMRSEGAY